MIEPLWLWRYLIIACESYPLRLAAISSYTCLQSSFAFIQRKLYFNHEDFYN